MSDNEKRNDEEVIEEGSFADPSKLVKVKPQKRTPPADANATLFKLMREIKDVIKENTEALNSLLTVVLTQKPIKVTTKPEVDIPDGYEGIGAISLSKSEASGVGENIPLPQPEIEQKVEVSSETMSDIDVIKGTFPEYLVSLLEFTFEREGRFIKAKPRQFLGSSNFAKIAAIVRELGGDYISAGKDSHFRIHKP